MRERMDQKNSEYVHFSRSGFFFLMYTLLNIILWEYTCTGKILVNICHLNQNAQKRPPLLLQARSATLLKKRLWHRCFSVNFAKFLRTLFLQNTSRRLLLYSKSRTNQFTGFYMMGTLVVKRLNLSYRLNPWDNEGDISIRRRVPTKIKSIANTSRLFQESFNSTERLWFLRPKIWKIIPNDLKWRQSLREFKFAIKS